MQHKEMKPFYRKSRGTLLGWFNVWNDFRVAGKENVPADGPFLLACNHASFLDPPVFAAASPRELHFFARSSLWKGSFGNLISNLNAIPVERGKEGDLSAFRRVFGVFKEGGALLVFPEGTRTPDGELHPGKKGVGMIACRAQVPVVPARVFGSYQMWSRHRKLPQLTTNLGVSFGPAIPVEGYDMGKEDPERYETAAAKIMEAIAALQDPRVINELPFKPAV